MRKYIRHTDELIELQDKAIKALQQALLATQLALEVLQKDRDERGHQEQWNGQLGYPTPTPNYPSPYVPYTIPSTGWTLGSPALYPTITVTNANGQVYDVKYDIDETAKAKQAQDKLKWLQYEQYKADVGNAGSSVNTVSSGYIKVN